MVDILTPKARSDLMRRIRAIDTKPELTVRRALHSLGYRYRTHVRELPGSPDLVFSRRRSVIFVHGCFWHQHGCEITHIPKTRREFWKSKFGNNIKRDRRNKEALHETGWNILVVWECETRSIEKNIERILHFLGPPRFVP